MKGGVMSKVVWIFRGKFLGDYIARQKGSGMLEYGPILLGVLAAIVVLEVVYCVNGGPVSPWLFIVSGQVGVIFGLVKYTWPVAIALSVVDGQTDQVSQDYRIRRRKLP
jgi:hypothetical protein